MSNGGGSSGLSSSTGAREHSRKSIAGQFANSEMSEAEKLEWIKDTTGVNEKEAKEILEQVEKYLDGEEWEYKDIHNGKNKRAEEVIDRLLNNRKVATYKGETFRGIYIRPDGGKSGARIIEEMLGSGRWYEPGISSFSTDRSVAMDFADPLMGGGNGFGLVLRNVSNKTGVPAAHLSGHFNEMEVMHSSASGRRGFKVLNWKRVGNIYHADISE